METSRAEFASFVRQLLCRYAGIKHSSTLDILTSVDGPYLPVFEQAFTCPGAGPTDACHYENFEFVGDTILGMAISMLILKKFGDQANPGNMTQARARLVQSKTLAQWARQLGFVEYIRMLPVQRETKMTSILEDVFEAFLYAIERTLSQVFRLAKRTHRKTTTKQNTFATGRGILFAIRFVETVFQSYPIPLCVSEPSAFVPYKNQLQELYMRYAFGHTYPKYVRIASESGFRMAVEVPPALRTREAFASVRYLGVGNAGRKKQAETEAARIALESLFHHGVLTSKEMIRAK